MIYGLSAVKRSEPKSDTSLLGREAETYKLAEVAKCKSQEILAFFHYITDLFTTRFMFV